tara:strand:- start:2456 stop:3292 length:837 start_codon:yes stop_codon:yes gene_type:complete
MSKELTAKQSMLILDIVNDAKNMSVEDLKNTYIQYSTNANPDMLEAINNELSKVPKFKDFFKTYGWIASGDTTKQEIITEIAPGGAKHSLAPDNIYKDVKMSLDSAINKYNMAALEMQTLQSDYTDLKKEWFKGEGEMNYLKGVAEHLNPSLWQREIKKKVQKENPELFKSMQDTKNKLIETRSNLVEVIDDDIPEIPYNQQNMHSFMMNSYTQNWAIMSSDTPESLKTPYVKWGKAKNELLDAVKVLNLYEDDELKTVLPLNLEGKDMFSTIKLEDE